MKSHMFRLFGIVVAIGLLVPFAPRTVATHASPPEKTNDVNNIVINEVMFYPDIGGYEWVELKNNGTAPKNINGYALTDEDRNWYKIPDALPDVPVGGFVVIVFDGLGSSANDYDFRDNVATLHSPQGMVNILEDQADQVALYTGIPPNLIYLPFIQTGVSTNASNLPSANKFSQALHNPILAQGVSIVSFVAWGAKPGEKAKDASAAGLWDEGWYVSLQRGLGFTSLETAIKVNESIGWLPKNQTAFPENWTIYSTNGTSFGSNNPVPVISWFYPGDGATIAANTFMVSWNAVEGATGYRFQLNNTNDFSSTVLVEVTLDQPSYISLSSMADGKYFWRVKVLYGNSESSWTAPVSINSLSVPAQSSDPINGGENPSSAITLGIVWQLQHKDTHMLDLDGSVETGRARWDSSHEDDGDLTIGNGTPLRVNNLDNWYCVRASVSMMASYYGGHLSQDRISFQIYGGGPPEGDLGFGTGPDIDGIQSVLNWALGTSVTRISGKPSFSEIKNWIDSNQPIGSTIPGHMRVIDGYNEFSIGPIQWHFIHLLDPWDGAKWIDYDNDQTNFVYIGPSGAPNVRSDEPGISIDADKDGIVNFDEQVRFHTDPNNPDTDGDGVPDKADMREYVFDINGNYQPKPADFDHDGLRKELDLDNDNGGSKDGCEDTNHNGKYEPGLGETSNFDSKQEKSCSGSYFDDFSSYTPGLPPTGWLQRGTTGITPTVIEVGGTGPSYRLVNFPEVGWQYWDKWLLYPNLSVSSSFTVKVKMKFLNSVADRSGITIAWNDNNWDRIDIQPNVYGNDIEFRITYTGPNPSNVVINTLGSIVIDANLYYWLKVVANYPSPGKGQVDVYWSNDNFNYVHVLQVTGLPDLTGIVGMSTAGPHMPNTYFDDFSVEYSN